VTASDGQRLEALASENTKLKKPLGNPMVEIDPMHGLLK
jgi:hypothetical protein